MGCMQDSLLLLTVSQQIKRTRVCALIFSPLILQLNGRSSIKRRIRPIIIYLVDASLEDSKFR
jgi:hypothetical protein